MTKLRSKKITKYLTIIIVIMMLCNFVMPNYVYADTDTDGGGDLLKYIAKFIAYLCDRVMQKLQESFTSLDEIDQGEGNFNFQYSPAIIFSGTVPALDVNFLDPTESRTAEMTNENWINIQTNFLLFRKHYAVSGPISDKGGMTLTEFKSSYNYQDSTKATYSDSVSNGSAGRWQVRYCYNRVLGI